MDRREGRCQFGGDAAELALGLLAGGERAGALAHVASCRSCRAEVEQLAEVSDRLLLLAPPAEPPPGFESHVLGAMAAAQVEPAPARAWGRNRRIVMTVAIAASAAVALTVGLALGASSPAQPLTWESRMITPSGRDVGEVRLQDSEPPWLLVSVPGWRHWDAQVGHALDYRVRVQMADGRTIELDDVALSSEGAWGTTPELDPSAVREVSIVDASGRVWCTARIAARP